MATANIVEAGPSGTHGPAVHQSAKKKKRKKDTVYTKSDEEVWSLNDSDIIGITLQYFPSLQHSTDSTVIAASREHWTSKSYDHYTITIRRLDEDGRKTLIFKFTCKHLSPTHDSHERERCKTSGGTTNLQKSAAKCDAARGVMPLPTLVTAASGSASLPYSEAAHRTVIALRSATSHRPFNAVADKYYKMEVELLRPGTKIPSPKTVSLDINTLYLELSKGVRAYFKVNYLKL
jgi:hypothetical protein